jgi:hypothetical protein
LPSFAQSVPPQCHSEDTVHMDDVGERRRGLSPSVGAAGRLRLAPVAVAAIFALASCSDATGPSPATCRLPTAALPEAALLGTVIGAESQRVVANLPQNSLRNAVSTSLTALTVPLNAGLCSSDQIASASAAVASYQPVIQGSAAAQADLESLRLALDAVQRFLDGLQ